MNKMNYSGQALKRRAYQKREKEEENQTKKTETKGGEKQKKKMERNDGEVKRWNLFSVFLCVSRS